MKKLKEDESGLIFLPIVVGISALAGYLGFNWLTGGTDPMEFLKVAVIAVLLSVFGFIALTGKLVLLPRFLSIIIGISCICLLYTSPSPRD